MTGPERRDRLDLDAGSSWAMATESGVHYQLLLDGDEKRIVPLAVDTGHSHPDGTHPFRRHGEMLPLLGLIDPPIRIGSPVRLVVGNDPDGLASSRTTSPVVEIRRLG